MSVAVVRVEIRYKYSYLLTNIPVLRVLSVSCCKLSNAETLLYNTMALGAPFSGRHQFSAQLNSALLSLVSTSSASPAAGTVIAHTCQRPDEELVAHTYVHLCACFTLAKPNKHEGHALY